MQPYLFNNMAARIFMGVIILQSFIDASGVLDFTCFSIKPRIVINGDNGMLIGGYKSGDDTDASVSFGRTINTGTGSELPTDSSESDHRSASARLLNMPQSGGKQRIGAFHCEAQKGDVTERITTIIMASNSDITPQHISQTVSVGESVTFAMVTNVRAQDLRWRRNGGGISKWRGQKQVTINSASDSNKGVYECHANSERGNGVHAIFQLIVRACGDGMWGPSTCQGECPQCYNGGICDDRSGDCVCAPGFSGTNCQSVHGRNRWGQDGQLRCSGSNPHGTGCRGKLFCLSHPYGCSCAAGYKGIDCDEECTANSYGANCRSQCNCAIGVSCLKDTGECDGGQCHPDWYGVNCQEPQRVTGLHIIPDSNTLIVQWDPDPSPCSNAIEYVVTYELRNLEQCAEQQNSNIVEAGVVSSTDITIENLHYYSSYTIHVKAIHNKGVTEGETTSLSKTTGQEAPSDEATISPVYTSTSNTLAFSWNEVMCGMRRGPGLQYAYTLKLENEVVIQGMNADTSVSFSDLTECTQYYFEVQAVNDIGNGPISNTLASTAVIEPGIVNSLMVSATPSSNQLLISWEKSTANNCPDDYYVIRSTLVNKDHCQMVTETFASEFHRNTDDLHFSLDELLPYSTYNVSVVAANTASEGIESFFIQTTNISKPSSSPFNVSATKKTSRTITFEWSEPPCGERHGHIVSYSYLLRDENGTAVTTNSTSFTSVMFTNLKPFTNYSFHVAAITVGGEGPQSDEFIVSTDEAVASAPIGLAVEDVDKTSMTVTWQEPKHPNGIIKNYSVELKISEKPYDLTFDTDPNPIKGLIRNITQRRYKFRGLKPSTKYEIKVSAHSKAGKGDEASVEQFTHPATVEDLMTPDKLPDIEEEEITPTTVNIEIPQSSAEFVTSYQVGVILKTATLKRDTSQIGSSDLCVVAELPKSTISENPAFIVGDNKTYGMYHNSPLMEGKEYTLYTAFVSRIDQTTFGVSWSKGVDVKLPSNKEKQISSTSPILVPVIGVVIVVVLIAVVVGIVFFIRRKRKDPHSGTPNDIALAPQESKVYSGQLMPGFATANVETSLEADDEPQATNQNEGVENNTYVDLEETEPKLHPSPPRKSTPLLESHVGPIKLHKFEKYVHEKKASQANSFAVDFKTLPGDNLHPWIVAKKRENKKKNRYANITTYDSSRVILPPLEGDPHSDYINASFIDGVYEQKKYIASQGPNTASLDDFWRMVWHYNVKKIVMLTNLIESGKLKCEQYWPDTKTTKGGIMITLRKEDQFADYVLRTFQIQHVASGQIRELRQYHFITWPDMGVPQCPSVLNFMKIVNDYKPRDAGPTVIHCSAGVGRTGTYITIDEMLVQAKQEGAIDVYQFVSKMRNSRMKMVQITAQYRFIFDALLEDIICGDTSIQKKSFQSEFKKMNKIDAHSRKSGFQKQFEALEKVTVWPKEDKCKGGIDPINAPKNRFPDIIPTDRSRPCLKTEVAKNTNYINASHIDGFLQKDQHIVTQMPLPDTVADIWRLVYDYNSYSIVMLNRLDYKDSSMVKYWPDKGHTTTFGPLTVACIDEDRSLNDVTIRTFHLSNAYNQGEGVRTISQLVLHNWPAGDDEPNSADSLLALVKCLKQQQKRDTLQHVTALCFDGVGASCVFIAIMTILEQLEYSNTVDVFQTVRSLRLARPQAVRNLVQYTFCYKAIQSHFSSFGGNYENYQLPDVGQHKSSPNDMQDGDIYANVPSEQHNSSATDMQDGDIYANIPGGQHDSSSTDKQDGDIYANVPGGQHNSYNTSMQDGSIYANV